MSITCAQCSYTNPDNSGFCVRCGNRLQQSSSSQSTFSPTPSAPPTSSYLTPSAPSFPPPNPTPSAPAFPANKSSSSLAPPQWPTSMQPPPPPATQMGMAEGLGSMRRAFAGHGTLIAHQSWLLNGNHAQAVAVRNATRDKLQQRGIAKLTVNPETLMERGLLMEERDYLVAQRGICTVFIYVAPAGQDLYISRASTVLPAISNLRIVVFSLLFLITLFGPTFVRGLLPDAAGIVLGSLLTFITFPLWLFFIWLLIRSFIYWLREKDFWRYLRPNFLNYFNLDDLMLLEHVTDDTVRDAVEQVGLDATKIVPPTQGYQPKQKIRAL